MSKENPVGLSSRGAARAPDCTLVVFGINGDLSHRLLLPALYNLAHWKLLPQRFRVIGVGRTKMTAERLRQQLTDTIGRLAGDKGAEFSPDTLEPQAWRQVVGELDYVTGDIEDPSTYDELTRRLDRGEASSNVLFYLAVAARLFWPIVERLGRAGLFREQGAYFRRVIIEKPFGADLASARALNANLLRVLDERQIFRIDHFLGKETVQNILALRFGNGLFEPLWNRDRIDHVQITVAEIVGVEKRGAFYDGTGALRDMVPNHLFQLFTLTAMEPPSAFEAQAIRDRKQDVLTAVRPLSGQAVLRDTVRAQYRAGCVQGRGVPDYRAEPDVDPGSRTETYAALRLTVDNWRWAGVPFYLRTGKALKRRETQIAIRFKDAPLALLRGTGVEACIANWLVLQIQPDEGISLQFGAKVPGIELRLDSVTMDFLYKDYFRAEPSTGYETLIYDAMIGDATLFQRTDNIEASWRVVEPVLGAWRSGCTELATYAAGSGGPAEADALLGRDGRAWRAL